MNYGTYIDFTIGNLNAELSDLMQITLENYLCHGLAPGGFMTAVLANDLMAAVANADYWNKSRLAGIAEWIRFYAPDAAWSSYDHVRNWIADTDGRRSKWFEKIEQKYVWDKLQEPAQG